MGFASIIAVVIILVAGFVAFEGKNFLNPSSNSSTSTVSETSNSTSTTSLTTESQVIQGIITGYVTVGPSQPVCQANESCNVNVTGYSLEFASSCANSSSVTGSSCRTQTYSAQLSPNGHFSILLPPGQYQITGLSPSCAWMGCSSAFPVSVEVMPGQQIVQNVNIDTGIR